MRLSSARYPALTPENHEETSPPDAAYNCIAWAVGDTDNFWWPDRQGGYYWPHDAPMGETLEAFTSAFSLVGYEPCDDGSLEPEYEKIAVFALAGSVKHAARQLADGRWTSKIGSNVDISHADVNGVSGPFYGDVVLFLRRPLSGDYPRPPNKPLGRNSPCWCGSEQKYKRCHGR